MNAYTLNFSRGNPHHVSVFARDKMEGQRLALGISNHAAVASENFARPTGTSSIADLRTHFARELHDRVAHPLVDLLLQLHELRISPDTPSPAADGLAAAEDAARQVVRQAREMMIELRGRAELKRSVATAVKADVPVPTGRKLTVNVTPRWPRRTNGWAAFNLLRIVQQAAANAWRHGRASNVEVLLDVEERSGEAVLLVMDDGSGVSEGAYGFGIDGMRERAIILDGLFSIRARPDGGTTVEVRLPVASLA
jgi:signal transduction histidine kinase